MMRLLTVAALAAAALSFAAPAQACAPGNCWPVDKVCDVARCDDTICNPRCPDGELPWCNNWLDICVGVWLTPSS